MIIRIIYSGLSVFPYSLLIGNVDADEAQKPEWGPEKAIDNDISTFYYSKEGHTR